MLHLPPKREEIMQVHRNRRNTYHLISFYFSHLHYLLRITHSITFHIQKINSLLQKGKIEFFLCFTGWKLLFKNFFAHYIINYYLIFSISLKPKTGNLNLLCKRVRINFYF